MCIDSNYVDERTIRGKTRDKVTTSNETRDKVTMLVQEKGRDKASP